MTSSALRPLLRRPRVPAPPLRLTCRFPPPSHRRAPAVWDPEAGPHPDGDGSLLLTSNDDASNRLRASPSFRDPDLQELPPTARDDTPPGHDVGSLPPGRRNGARTQQGPPSCTEDGPW